jgi:hypothetical protein
MINKYNKLHEKFLEELVEYHNLNMNLKNKSTYNNFREITKVVMRIGAIIKALKLENLEVRKEIQRRHKLRQLEIAEEKLKKENKNDNSSN